MEKLTHTSKEERIQEIQTELLMLEKRDERARENLRQATEAVERLMGAKTPEVSKETEKPSEPKLGTTWEQAYSDLKEGKYASPDEIPVPPNYEEQPRAGSTEKNPIDLTEEIIKPSEVEKEIAKLSPEDKEKINWGLNTFGFKVGKMKDDFFADVFDEAINGVEIKGHKITKGVGERGAVGKFYGELRDYFIRNSKEAVKKANDESVFSDTKLGINIKGQKRGINISAGEKKFTSNIGAFSGNALKYIRLIFDATGFTVGAVSRIVMAVGMASTVLAEAGKETHFKNEKVIEKTRIRDADLAYEEAWNIYQNARQNKGTENVSVEALKNAYLMEMPKDLQKRLGDPAVANNFVQRTLRRELLGYEKKGHVVFEGAISRLNKKIEKLENNNKLTDEERKIEIEKLITKQKKNLEDYDRMITQYGTIDWAAMLLRYAQTAGKATVAVSQVETLVISADKICETMSNIYHSFHEIIKSEGIVGLTQKWLNEYNPFGAESERLEKVAKARFKETTENGKKVWIRKRIKDQSIVKFYENGEIKIFDKNGRFIGKQLLDEENARSLDKAGLNIRPLAPETPAAPGLETSPVEPSHKLEPLPADNPNPPIEKLAPDIKNFTGVKFEHGKGGIKGILELQEQIKTQYGGDYSRAPESVRNFMNTDATKQAIKLGLFDPNNPNGEESAQIQAGTVLKFDEQGNLLFGKPDASGKIPVLEKYHGKMFDSDGSAKIPPVENPTEYYFGPQPKPAVITLSPKDMESTLGTKNIPDTTSAEELKTEIEKQIDTEEKREPNVPDQPGEKLVEKQKITVPENTPSELNNPRPETIGTGSKAGIGSEAQIGTEAYTGGGAMENGRNDDLYYKGQRMEPFRFNMGGHPDQFPDLPHRDSQILEKLPEFRQNDFNLSGKRLIQTYEAYNENMSFLFGYSMENADTNLAKIIDSYPAHKILENTFSAPEPDRLSKYLNLLKSSSNLEPRTGFLGFGRESSKQYIARALQALAAGKGREGISLETFQNILRK